MHQFEKKTGVKVKYIQPATGQFAESFNLMIASGEYADMMEVNWINQYAGGPSKAFNDGVLIDIS